MSSSNNVYAVGQLSDLKSIAQHEGHCSNHAAKCELPSLGKPHRPTVDERNQLTNEQCRNEQSGEHKTGTTEDETV